MEELRQDGFRSLDKFECSTSTIVTGNVHRYCKSGINNNGITGTARATTSHDGSVAAATFGSIDDQDDSVQDYHDDVKIVRFADEEEQEQQGAHHSSSSLVT